MNQLAEHIQTVKKRIIAYACLNNLEQLLLQHALNDLIP